MAFAYFVFHFVSGIEGDDPTTQLSQDARKAKELAKYYKKDALGDWILAVGKVPTSKAKEIWRESPVMKQTLALFPKFNLMKETIMTQVEEGEFRRQLLKRLDDVANRYLSGEIDAEKAKELIRNL
ncbi:hypothetical protein [Nitratifractor salsuginis]|nr:hypothetical protein [Nitratifractor salsuginis]